MPESWQDCKNYFEKSSTRIEPESFNLADNPVLVSGSGFVKPDFLHGP